MHMCITAIPIPFALTVLSTAAMAGRGDDVAGVAMSRLGGSPGSPMWSGAGAGQSCKGGGIGGEEALWYLWGE